MKFQATEIVVGDLDGKCCILEFTSRRYFDSILDKKQKQFKTSMIYERTELHDLIENQLQEYFLGKRQEFTIPFVYSGTDFQEKVWQELLKIPYGETCSYGDIASRVGNAKAMRAVGAANGANNLAIIIPCHRVIRADGHLQGYGGGLKLKEQLLNLEKQGIQGEFQSQLDLFI